MSPASSKRSKGKQAKGHSAIEGVVPAASKPDPVGEQ